MPRAIGSQLLVLAVLLPLHAQSDPDQLLQRAIAQARDSIDRLPNYLCTQMIDRVTYWPPQHWWAQYPGGGCDWWPASDRFRLTASDRVRVDILSTDGGELYSWAGGNQFQDLLQLVPLRPISTGGFSGFLRAIFANGSAFPYRGEVNENGRKLQEYAFRVPRDKSVYWLGTSVERLVVGMEGVFRLDPETADMVRLVVRPSEPPEVTGACQATTTLTYSRTRVNDSEILLPSSALFEFAGAIRPHVLFGAGPSGAETRDSSVFTGCREFRGESTVRFDLPPAASPAPAKAPERPALALPDGIPFRLALGQDLVLRTAAAGDTISLRLATPIEDSSKQVLLPAATPVTARILDAEFMRIPSEKGIVLTAFLSFRLESLTMAGTERSFVATTAQPIESADPNSHSGGSPINDMVPAMVQGVPEYRALLLAPNTVNFQFYRVRPDFVVKAGQQSKWRTGGTGPTVDCLSGSRSCK